MDFYKCEHCKNILTFMQFSGVVPVCCGAKMQKLAANTTDAAVEKHVPLVNIIGNQVKVQVGNVEHPMQEVHYIEWIVFETTLGQVQIKYLHPGEMPVAEFFMTASDTPKAVYAYCNLHGLWVTEI